MLICFIFLGKQAASRRCTRVKKTPNSEDIIAKGKSTGNPKIVTPIVKVKVEKKTEDVPKKKIVMDEAGATRGDVIDLTRVDTFLQQKKTANAIVIDDDDDEGGKLTLKLYKSEVVWVEGKKKFCVVVDLVDSRYKKSLWCNDGAVMIKILESMADHYSFEAFKNTVAVDMRDEPGSNNARGKTNQKSGIFYTFKVVVFTLAVADSIDSAADVLFNELATKIFQLYCSVNFQELFFMIKSSMPGGLPMKFKRILKDSFDKGTDFAFLQKNSFTMEKVEDVKLIDFVTDRALKSVIIPALFSEELQALNNANLQEEEYDDIDTKVRNFGR